MIKNSIFFIGLLFSFATFSAEKYILVYFHGFGGPENEDIKERSKVPEVLINTKILKVFDGSHNVADKKFFQVLDNFACKNGIQTRKDLGLVIIGYSWGSKAAYDFSKEYLKKCGQKADRVYLIDGVLKPIQSFPVAPIGKVCKNYYKTIIPIRGKALKNCENADLTELCIQYGGKKIKGFNCHQYILRIGNDRAIEDIIKNL